jgi:hypothetical protein
MTTNLYRTGETSLTDDELLLLDVLFDKNITKSFLYRENFAVRLNARAHELFDEEVDTTIDRFCDLGYLVPRESFKPEVPAYEMTGLGGSLWEAERLPQWEHYGSDRYVESRSGKEILLFVSPSDATCRFFMGHWRRCPERLRFWSIKSYELLSWRSFPRLYVGSAFYSQDAWHRDQAERESLESHRTWWRCVRELQRFLPQRC